MAVKPLADASSLLDLNLMHLFIIRSNDRAMEHAVIVRYRPGDKRGTDKIEKSGESSPCPYAGKPTEVFVPVRETDRDFCIRAGELRGDCGGMGSGALWVASETEWRGGAQWPVTQWPSGQWVSCALAGNRRRAGMRNVK